MNINSHYCEKVFTQNANRRSRSMRKCVHGECETPFTMHANTHNYQVAVKEHNPRAVTTLFMVRKKY